MATGYGSTPEASNPFCLSDGEAAALLHGHPWRRFVVVGDSVAEGLGDRVEGYSDLPWADRIAAELCAQAPHFAYLNLGRRNLHAAEVRAGQLAAALDFNPDLALVCCGGNDAIHPGYQPEDVRREVGAIIGTLREHTVDVITVGLFDLSYCPAVPERFRPALASRMAQLADLTRELGAAHGTLHFDLSNHPAVRDPAMYSSDGLHGNMRSHAIAAAEAIRRIGVQLGNTFPGPNEKLGSAPTHAPLVKS